MAVQMAPLLTEVSNTKEYYSISVKHSGMYLDVYGAEQNDGAKIIQYGYTIALFEQCL